MPGKPQEGTGDPAVSDKKPQPRGSQGQLRTLPPERASPGFTGPLAAGEDRAGRGRRDQQECCGHPGHATQTRGS